jgi:hypothetical protein
MKKRVTKRKINKRIPVPKKPPKIEAGKKSYNRRSEKKKILKRIREET